MTYFKALLISVIYGSFVAVTSIPSLEFDAVEYFQIGENLLNTGVYGLQKGRADKWREPAFPVFIAGGLAIAKVLHLDTPAAKVRWLLFLQSLLMMNALYFFSSGPYFSKILGRCLYCVCLLSPTFHVMNVNLFCEGFAASMLMLGFGFWGRAVTFKHSYMRLSMGHAGLAGLIFGIFLLTKKHMLPLLLVLTLVFGYAYLSKKLKKNLVIYRQGLFACLVAITLVGIWEFRSQFVRESEFNRVAIVLAAKVLRSHEIRKDEIPVGILASLGRSTCLRIFGFERCSKFDYPYSDHLGFGAWSSYVEKYNRNFTLAGKFLIYDMSTYWIREPLKQFFGTFLEFLKIIFFDQMVSYTNFGEIRIGPSFWHAFGNIAEWGFIGYFTLNFRKLWPRLSEGHRSLLVLALSVIATHSLIMSQLANVQRYVLPIVPAFMLISMSGLGCFLENLKLKLRL